jgi:hypothetical protein
MFWSVGWRFLRDEGFFCNLDILYGGLGIGKLQFLIKKNLIFFSVVIFFKLLVIKALDTDWIRIRISLQHQTLDPDPEKMNTDPKPCLKLFLSSRENNLGCHSGSGSPPTIPVPGVRGQKSTGSGSATLVFKAGWILTLYALSILLWARKLCLGMDRICCRCV